MFIVCRRVIWEQWHHSMWGGLHLPGRESGHNRKLPDSDAHWLTHCWCLVSSQQKTGVQQWFCCFLSLMCITIYSWWKLQEVTGPMPPINKPESPVKQCIASFTLTSSNMTIKELQRFYWAELANVRQREIVGQRQIIFVMVCLRESHMWHHDYMYGKTHIMWKPWYHNVLRYSKIQACRALRDTSMMFATIKKKDFWKI